MCFCCSCCCYFSASSVGLRNCKSVFLILKISQYGGPRRWVQFFLKYSCKNWYKDWYLHFHKTCDHKSWQADTSGGVDSNDSNRTVSGDYVVTGDIITSLQNAYGHQTWQEGNLPRRIPTHNVTCSFGHVFLRGLKPLYLHYHDAYGGQTW